MQIQKISKNENYNTNFCARLAFAQRVNDISKTTKRIWKQRAKSIGTDDDIITLHFETLMNEKTQKHIKNKSSCSYVKAVFASVMLNKEKIYNHNYIGYYVLNKYNSKENAEKLILDFFDQLDCR